MDTNKALDIVNAFFAKQPATHSLNEHFALMQAITHLENERVALKKQLDDFRANTQQDRNDEHH